MDFLFWRSASEHVDVTLSSPVEGGVTLLAPEVAGGTGSFVSVSLLTEVGAVPSPEVTVVSNIVINASTQGISGQVFDATISTGWTVFVEPEVFAIIGTAPAGRAFAHDSRESVETFEFSGAFIFDLTGVVLFVMPAVQTNFNMPRGAFEFRQDGVFWFDVNGKYLFVLCHVPREYLMISEERSFEQLPRVDAVIKADPIGFEVAGATTFIAK